LPAPRTNVSGLFTFPPDISFADSIFDQMMVSQAAVYRQDNVLDSYGNIVQNAATYVQLPTNLGDQSVLVPCAVRSFKGEELNTPPAPASQTSHSIQEFLIFMRVIQVDTPLVPLNVKHFLQILTPAQIRNNVSLLDPNVKTSGAVLYNITNISNPLLLDHHLEVAATVITP